MASVDNDPVKRQVLMKLADIKEYLLKHGGMTRNIQARQYYAATLVFEGAVLFGDETEFAEVCLEFAAKKEREITEKN